MRKYGQDNTTIRDAYDSVISGCMEILQQSTLEMRREAPDVRDDVEVSRRLFGRHATDPDPNERRTDHDMEAGD